MDVLVVGTWEAIKGPGNVGIGLGAKEDLRVGEVFCLRGVTLGEGG
jgi:hypothetical protein